MNPACRLWQCAVLAACAGFQGCDSSGAESGADVSLAMDGGGPSDEPAIPSDAGLSDAVQTPARDAPKAPARDAALDDASTLDASLQTAWSWPCEVEQLGQRSDASLGQDAGACQLSCYDRVVAGATWIEGAKAAILAGIQYYESEPIPPEALLFADFMYRRFGVLPFADALEGYDATVAADYADDPYYRVIRRIADPATPYDPSDWDSVESPADQLTFSALYCVDRPLPLDYGAMLMEARAAGGYDLTHAGLALIWLEENGCASPLDEGFRTGVETDMADLVRPADGLDDIEIEAIAFLLQMGRSDLVRSSWLGQIVESRLPGSGWRMLPAAGPAHWHPTGLAIWGLLLYECPETNEPLARQP